MGSSESHKVDVRIVSATNRDLRCWCVRQPFQRRSVLPHQYFSYKRAEFGARLDDVLPLANFFILKHSRENRSLQFSPEAVAKLLSYTWPGNVRELENVVQRAIVLTSGDVIQPQYLIFDEPSLGPGIYLYRRCACCPCRCSNSKPSSVGKNRRVCKTPWKRTNSALLQKPSELLLRVRLRQQPGH